MRVDPILPTVAATATPAGSQNVQANPMAFGGATADATARLGGALGQASDVAAKAIEARAVMATDAATNDVIANQWGPTVAKITGDYRRLYGKDAVDGYQPMVETLQKTRDQFMGDATSPLMKQQLGNYMTRHLAQELDGASRWKDTQQTAYEDQSNAGMVKEQAGQIIANYNDPDRVTSAKATMDAAIQMHGTMRGQPAEAVTQAQQAAWGGAIYGAVHRAIANNDLTAAQKLYRDNMDSIPGPQRLEIDQVMHPMMSQQNGATIGAQLLAGMPTHAAVAAAPHLAIPPDTDAAIVQAAAAGGVDANHLRAIAARESSGGTDPNAKNLGQVSDATAAALGRPIGGTIAEQAVTMAAAARQAQDKAQEALGRTPSPAESYVAYQQGAAGGPALLRNPDAPALVALTAAYGGTDRAKQMAAAAITKNGGTLSMTAGQFADTIKRQYESSAAASAASPVTVPPTSAPVQVQDIPAPTAQPAATPTPPAQGGPPLQPGANPLQNLENFNAAYPSALARANAISNLADRAATVSWLEQQHAVYSGAATAYKGNLTLQAQQLAADPKFTDNAQIPPDLRAALADNPLMMAHLDAAAAHNQKGRDVPPTADNQATWARMVGEASSDPAAFADRDLTALYGQMPLHQWQGLVMAQKAINAKDAAAQEKQTNVVQAMGWLQGEMRGAGLDPKPKAAGPAQDRLNEFRGQLAAALDDAREANGGKRLSQEQTLDVGRQMLTKGAIADSGFLRDDRTTLAAAQISGQADRFYVPAASIAPNVKAGMVNDWKARYGGQPPDDATLSLWATTAARIDQVKPDVRQQAVEALASIGQRPTSLNIARLIVRSKLLAGQAAKPAATSSAW